MILNSQAEPSMDTKIMGVIDATQLADLFHELVGHPVEDAENIVITLH